MDWAVIGFTVMGTSLLAFATALLKRQWTIWALLAGLANLPMAFIHAVAPFRGWLDPDYAGYSMGIIRADPGIEVASFTGLLLVSGVVSAIICALNKPGRRNDFVIGSNLLVLLLTVPTLIDTLLRTPDSFRIEFGEYLQFAGFSAFLFEFALLSVPLTYSALWAWKKAGASPTE
jgi:hypothetical protein